MNTLNPKTLMVFFIISVFIILILLAGNKTMKAMESSAMMFRTLTQNQIMTSWALERKTWAKTVSP